MSRKKLSVFTGTKEEIINGQTVTIKQYQMIDLDKQLDYDRIYNDIMSANSERNESAKQELAEYTMNQLIAESERRRQEEEDGI
jgi:hypothetical protein